MRTLAQVVRGQQLYHIEAHEPVTVAARRMRERAVSALPVLTGNRLIGIVTERDLVQRVIADGRDPAATRVEEVMSRHLAAAPPETTYDEALARMKRRHVRHLLVVAGDHLLGLVSMRDLLRVESTEKTVEIELLTAYIHAIPPELPPPVAATE